MKAFYCDRFVLPLPAGHRFPMAKYRLLRERLLAEAIVSREDLLEPPAAAWEDLALVHAPGYLRQVASGTLPADHQRRIGFPWSSAMVERSRRSVGATIEAARVLMRDGAIARPAIVDCDVHQGNGTAAIFAGDEAVFTCSLHGEKNFPFRKERGGLDVMLPDGTADAAYLDALARALEEVFARHDPDFLFYVSGADAYEGDRLGRLHLSIEGLRRRDELVFERAGRAGVPVAVVMGGGYAEQLEAVVTIHANTISTAASHAVHQPRRSAHARPIAPAARATPPIGWEPANG
jgi:acetoin utilization deacetylase AcuC-like enzyme